VADHRVLIGHVHGNGWLVCIVLVVIPIVCDNPLLLTIASSATISNDFIACTVYILLAACLCA
jgi:hypothetical protein